MTPVCVIYWVRLRANSVNMESPRGVSRVLSAVVVTVANIKRVIGKYATASPLESEPLYRRKIILKLKFVYPKDIIMMMPSMIDPKRSRKVDLIFSPSIESFKKRGVRPEIASRLSFVSALSSSEGSEHPLSGSLVRAFLTDYFEDLNTLAGTPLECWKAFYNRNHSPQYTRIQSTGQTINSEELVGLFTSGNVSHHSSLVSLDNVTVLAGGMSAVATFRSDESWINLGKESTERIVVTAILEIVHGEIKLVHEHRSMGVPILKETRWSNPQNYDQLPSPIDKFVPLNVTAGNDRPVQDTLVPLKGSPTESRAATKSIRLPGINSQELSSSRWSREITRVNSDSSIKLPSRNKKVKSCEGFVSKPKRESDALSGSFHCKRRDSSDQLLVKPRRSKSLAVSSAVLECITKKGSSDRVSQGAQSLHNGHQPPSKQANATWDRHSDHPRISTLSPGIRTRLCRGMSLNQSCFSPSVS